MKCKDVTKPEKPVFKPVTIQITFETADELAAFSGLFGCTPVTDNMPWDYEPFYHLAKNHGVSKISADEMCSRLKKHSAMIGV